jgi:hypothetical protein
MFKTGSIQSSKSEEEEVRCFAQSSTYTERPSPPSIEEETLFIKHKCLGGNKNLADVTLSVFTSVRSDVLCRCSIQTIFSLHQREKEKVKVHWSAWLECLY